jgi:1-phosphatidylinositol-4-phosphate 5-kinase
MQRYNADKKFTFPPDLEKNISKNLTFEITEYATLIFQNLRSLYSLDQEMFRNSLLPFNNTRTLTKSFEKTSAKGGKPLIKTHDKKYLIKEVKKEEKEFFMQILPKFHLHLKKNAKSLMAKIVGVYGIKIGNKDKVY